MGYKIIPGEDDVNNMAYNCMGMHKMNQAFQLFKRNTDNYPQSANAWDSLGECYAAMGNKQKAIEAYQKSLSLQETTDTRRKLNELLGKK
jgi:tetratricopeptide (TPR) repeat protein